MIRAFSRPPEGLREVVLRAVAAYLAHRLVVRHALQLDHERAKLHAGARKQWGQEQVVTMRTCSVVTDPASLQLHDHVAWCGRGPEALEPLAEGYFAAGVERNERMLYVSGTPGPSGLARSETMKQLADAGSLEMVDMEAIYGGDLGFDPDTQEAIFKDLVAEALHDGYSGLRVAADNTTLVARDDELFDNWLAWEHRADAFEAANPVIGICYFDRERVDASRLADLAALHPLRSASTLDPAFQLFVDGDSLRAVGTLD